jgi:hypothetical protein
MGEISPEGGAPGLPVRVFLFLPWADGIEDAASFVGRLPGIDVALRVADRRNEQLVRMARLDLDWHGETARCFAALTHPRLGFLPSSVVGPQGLSEVLGRARSRPAGESWWLAFTAQHPQRVGSAAGRLCEALRRCGVEILFYAYDEASRTMPCFPDIAPHLDVLIHDELPLAEPGAGLLRRDCLAIHRSWVANVLPFAAPFPEHPEERILFLGSEMGLTQNRRRQIEFLRARFADRFIAIHDHSLGVAERSRLGRYKVSLCPEGRKFSAPAMSRTHTDRPFWSGCLGMVPVSEDSSAGGRLADLGASGLLVGYPHGDLDGLAAACEAALAAGDDQRRRIYEHYNRAETVGRVVADAIAAGC